MSYLVLGSDDSLLSDTTGFMRIYDFTDRGLSPI